MAGRRASTPRARALDMVADETMDAVIQAFIEDDLDPAFR